MQAILTRGPFPAGMTRERALSLGASIAVNLGMIAAFASIANIDVDKVKEGASLVVVGLSGSESEAEAAETKPAASLPAPPPPPAEPAPRSRSPEAAEKEPDQQKLALIEPLEQAAERASAPAAQPSENRPSPEQLREAAAQQRRAQEAAKARAEQAENEAKAASTQASAASSAHTGGGYGAVILRHLQRFKRANSVGAGAALVRMTIDGSGTLQEVAIVRSSGLATFDREALQTVRRASPFPKPPGGDGRTINFAFTGR